MLKLVVSGSLLIVAVAFFLVSVFMAILSYVEERRLVGKLRRPPQPSNRRLSPAEARQRRKEYWREVMTIDGVSQPRHSRVRRISSDILQQYHQQSGPQRAWMAAEYLVLLEYALREEGREEYQRELEDVLFG